MVSTTRKFQVAAAAAVAAMIGLATWWRVEAARLEAAPPAAAARFEAAGWRFDFGATDVDGAPFRLDLSIADPRLSAQGGAFRAVAEMLTLKALIYRDDYIGVDAAGPIEADTVVGRVAADARGAAASLVFADRTDGAARALARVSVVVPGLTAAPLNLRGPAELHLRPLEPATPRGRRLFVRAAGPTAGPLEATFNGEAMFGAALTAAEPPDLVALNFRPGATLRWPDAEVTITGTLSRGQNGRWRGDLRFESDTAAAALRQLRAGGVVSSTAAAALKKRISSADRLAGVLSLREGDWRVSDVGPAAIPLGAR